LRATAIALAAGVRRPYVTVHGVAPAPSDPRLHHAVRKGGLALVGRLSTWPSTADASLGPPWHYLLMASPQLGAVGDLPFPGPGTTPTVAWVGRLDDPKQPEVFVRAVAAVSRSGTPVRGLMAGTGPRAARVAALVRETGAPVELLGHAPVEEVLAEAWMLALWSRSEGTPLAVQEAMWAGRAVVASPLPGIGRLVGGTGRLVGEEAAVDAIRGLCDHEAARAAGEAARARVRSLLTPDSPWPEVERAYAAC
jgi:glycosyltransferase involved in cell wall biosynthesis